MFDQT